MNTLSILNMARFIENGCGEIASVEIPSLAYNYLCIAAKRVNIFTPAKDFLLEMDLVLFLNLMTEAYMFESQVINQKGAIKYTGFKQVV